MAETPTRRPLRTSLQSKIVVFVLLCVVIPLLVMGGYLLERNQELLGEKVRETLSNHLFRKASDLDDWVNQRQRDAARWSASFVVYEGVESLSRPGTDKARIRRDLKDYLESVLGHYRVYESLFIVDLSGEVLAATREEQLESWGRELLAAGGPGSAGAISPLFRSSYLERPTLLVLQPIQDRFNHTNGYLVERLDLRELAAMLTPLQDADLAPSFWLLDGDGNLLARAGRLVTDPGHDTFLQDPAAK